MSVSKKKITLETQFIYNVFHTIAKLACYD